MAHSLSAVLFNGFEVKLSRTSISTMVRSELLIQVKISLLAAYISHLLVITIMCNPVLTTLNGLRVCVWFTCVLSESKLLLPPNEHKENEVISFQQLDCHNIYWPIKELETLVRIFGLLVGILNIRTVIFHSHNFNVWLVRLRFNAQPN